MEVRWPTVLLSCMHESDLMKPFVQPYRWPCYVKNLSRGWTPSTIAWSKGMRPLTEGMQMGCLRAYSLYSVPNSLCSMYSSTRTRCLKKFVACKTHTKESVSDAFQMLMSLAASCRHHKATDTQGRACKCIADSISELHVSLCDTTEMHTTTSCVQQWPGTPEPQSSLPDVHFT
jgi:hypothetical protein